MVFWALAIAITAIACAALYYAALGRPVNATAAGTDDATNAHFRLQLREIEGDIVAGRLGEAEGVAAKGEMAREVMRLEAEGKATPAPKDRRGVFAVAAVATAMLSFGVYGFLGNPQLPSLPLAERVPEIEMNLDDAIAKIEAQLQKTPDDVRGWTVIAPAYMQLGRFADAATAFRKVIALSGPTADLETDLGEALMMQNGGSAEGEPVALFKSAAARDPVHVRSRFYLAGESTRAGEYETAVTLWTELLALAKGDETWVTTAKAGLEAAKAGLNNDPGMPDDAAIRGMVDGLAKRLYAEGGTIGDWTQLVRSRLVLGEVEAAQADYEKAQAAYPDPAVRQELDVLAADNGLVKTKAPN
jgi:cytochrome c-type biogenesis protein CcmH